jgi:acyl-CoA synthetase (AMP-forming)/AMP-acid ligase II
MKILVLADSRGMFPQAHSWPNTLKSALGPDCQIFTYISGTDKWLMSICTMEEWLLDNFPDENFDLIIMQVGWHEAGACFWPKKIWEEIINTKYRELDEEFLVDKIEATESNSFTPEKIKYLYINRKQEQSVFESIQKKCKNFIFLSFHSLPVDNDLNKEYKLGKKHHYDMLRSNEVLSAYSSDTFNLPMNKSWAFNNCLPDGIHYNPNGVNHITNNLVKYIKRIGSTLTKKLLTSTNHQKLLEQAKQFGSQICSRTKQRDTVILSRSLDADLLALFWGCIIYNRIPLIVQHPSHKISSKEFDKKIEYIKKSTQPKLCVCSKECSESFSKFFDILNINRENIDDTKDLIPPSSENDFAFYQLSSGTTNTPKILRVTHKQAIENCEEYSTASDIDESSKIVSWLPAYHDMGLITSYLIPIIKNCTVDFIDTFYWLANPISFIEKISKVRATHIWMPNFAFSFLADRCPKEDLDDKLDLSCLTHAVSCSEPTHFNAINKFSKHFRQVGFDPRSVCNCYALAENVFAVSQIKNISFQKRNGLIFANCGAPMDGISVLILDEDGNDISEESKIGRVMIKSNTIVTEERSDFGYYDTGDLGYLIDGHIFITSRAKDAFVSFGNNIYPNLIEESISHPDLIPGRVACISVFDEGVNTNKVVLLAESDTEDSSALIKHILEHIKTCFDISAFVHVVPHMFIKKTSSGKISRSSTKEKFLQLASSEE